MGPANSTAAQSSALASGQEPKVQNSWIGLITLDCTYPNFLVSAGWSLRVSWVALSHGPDPSKREVTVILNSSWPYAGPVVAICSAPIGCGSQNADAGIWLLDVARREAPPLE